MKSLTEHLWFETRERVEFVNITATVEELVRKSGVKEGMVLVNAMHITASVFVNDDERGLHNDFKTFLDKLCPYEPASQKRQLFGREVVVAITAGKLDFGPWEQIFYGEFDGKRRKRVLVKVIGE
jgi:secondary thiamine-phosphate synthase enzyme